MEIAPGIHRFDTGPFNWYIVGEGGRFTLVDAGFPGHYQIFLDGIRQLGYTLQDLEAIILTHSHADHTGFAERLRATTNKPVFVHRDDHTAIGRTLQLPWYGLLSNAWRPYVRYMLFYAAWNGVFRGPHIRQAQTFSDGDRLDVPGKPQVIHVPGHTPGEVAFFLPERSVLISGDTLVTRNLLTGQLGPPQLPSRLLSTNDQEARRSIDRLKELGLVTMLPGHGMPWVGSMAEAVELANEPKFQSTDDADDMQ